MKILMITTWFYPDTAVAAKRPFHFAKYLTKFGHDVTVLRSGELYNKLDPNLNENDSGARVITYMDDNCPVLKFQRGEYDLNAPVPVGRLDFLPAKISKPIYKAYRRLIRSKIIKNEIATVENRLYYLKEKLSSLKNDGENFDIIFSTYGQLENAMVVEYATSLFNCPVVFDLRDHMVTNVMGNEYKKIMLTAEKNAMKFSAITTAVSKDLIATLSKRYPDKKLFTLYNGYEPANDKNFYEDSYNLSFCYTGALYMGQRDLTDLFRALRRLADDRKIDLEKVSFDYAGADFDVLEIQAEKFNLKNVLVNHGYVSRKQAFELQSKDDIFVVASWNTKEEQGILTGKFYEGIQAKRPILSVISGDVPNSELYEMNKEYNYGFCYEYCNEKTEFSKLCDYIEGVYNEKINSGRLNYNPSAEFQSDFKYESLAGKLESIMKECIKAF